MWLVCIGLLILFVVILDYFLIDKRLFELSEKFNGPWRLPFIGTDYIFLTMTDDYYSFFKNFMEKYLRTNLKVARIWHHHSVDIFIDDYKLMEHIFTNQKFMAKSLDYEFLEDIFGDGLLCSTDQKWFNRRKVITPAFHFKILEQFFDIFMKQNIFLIEKIKNEPNGKAFNIFPLVTNTALNSICETAMGYEMKAQDSNYIDAIKHIGDIMRTRMMTPWLRNKFLYNFSTTKRQQDKFIRIIRNFTTHLIEQRRKELTVEKIENLNDSGFGLKRKMCLLDVLLQSKIDDKPLSNDDIQEEVNTFTFGGHDTTSNAICFTLYLISMHPEVQEKINSEIYDVLGDNELTFKDLNDFKYLEIVIKESMRLYPPVPLIARRLFEEVDFGDFIAPANANYNLVLFTAFRNPEVFEKPDEFIPERFLTDMSPFAFVPFSAGQRNCIGQKYAMINIKTNIINILRNFTLTSGGVEPILGLGITLKCDSVLVGFESK